ncbi:MAG: efflux RND transporter periplasmic adaptor subunit, partial [Gemmatimonadota bacterium]|nr:efflux RND transporter periplasmic adaptor subunit [Gemmatimonadota bacterium]
VQAIGPENIALVKTDTLRSGPQLSGTLVPEREARIRSEVSGAVLQTMVEQGQRVSAGTTLGRIDDAAVNDQAISARSAVAQALVAVDQSARELQRSKTLLAAGAISERDVEGAERASLSAQAQLADAKARVSMAEKNIRNTVIHSPFVGVVSERSVSAGDVVAPGTALFTIVDPTSLRLEASVPAEAIGSIKVGVPVLFAVNGYPGRSFAGRVTRINPTADVTTRQVRIYATVANTNGRLVGGLFASGRVASETRVGLMIPDKALDQTGIAPFVVRVKNGKVEKVEVTAGLHDPATESTEITKGLSAGDTLLLAAAQGISVGTQVRVSTPKDAARP